jgi:hypothetical protein
MGWGPFDGRPAELDLWEDRNGVSFYGSDWCDWCFKVDGPRCGLLRCWHSVPQLGIGDVFRRQRIQINQLISKRHNARIQFTIRTCLFSVWKEGEPRCQLWRGPMPSDMH